MTLILKSDASLEESAHAVQPEDAGSPGERPKSVWWLHCRWITEFLYIMLGIIVLVLVMSFLIPEIQMTVKTRCKKLSIWPKEPKPRLPVDWAPHPITLQGISRGQAIFDSLRYNYRRTFYPLKEKHTMLPPAPNEERICIHLEGHPKNVLWVKALDPDDLEPNCRAQSRYILSTILPQTQALTA